MTDGRRSSSHDAGRPLSSYTVPLYDTTALTSALANPYTQHYAPHYYQAYWQAYASDPPRTTRDGYTLSSTYVPGRTVPTRRASIPAPSPSDRPPVQARPQTTATPIRNHLTYGSWYQPGHCRCARQGCPFTGSRKSVEIHMMDRHLVLPPGWGSKDDWDADPSLRGKPVAIQGTSLVLDTPEAIDAWIAERKRRFPTDERVRDKKRKLEEAAARGQLTAEVVGVGTRKRHRENTTSAERDSRGFRGQGRQRGRGRRWPGSMRREEPRTVPVDDSAGSSKAKFPQEIDPDAQPNADDDGAPEVASSRVPTLGPWIPGVDVGHDGAARRDSAVQRSRPHPRDCVGRVSQPKKPPRNPFASRSTLLRNLLLPEIRITVSNLSQAIHFLVENDFLHHVEVRPGEAQERMIEVLERSEVPSSANSTP